MKSFVANDVWAAKLRNLKAIGEFRDTDGRFLGYFTPALTGTNEDESYAQALTKTDPERMARAKADRSPGVTTAEVFEFLHWLEAKLESKTCASP